MPLGKRLRFRILNRDKFTCQYCGRKAPDVVLEVDHFVPQSRNGADFDDNLVTACSDCNGGKSSMLISGEVAPSISSDQVNRSIEETEREFQKAWFMVCAMNDVGTWQFKPVERSQLRTILSRSTIEELIPLIDRSIKKVLKPKKPERFAKPSVFLGMAYQYLWVRDNG